MATVVICGGLSCIKHETSSRRPRACPRERETAPGDDGLQQGLDKERIIGVARDERLAQQLKRR